MKLECGICDKRIHKKNPKFSTDFVCTAYSKNLPLSVRKLISNLEIGESTDTTSKILAFTNYLDTEDYVLIHEKTSPINQSGRPHHKHRSFIYINNEALEKSNGLISPFVNLLRSTDQLWNIRTRYYEDGILELDSIDFNLNIDFKDYEKKFLKRLNNNYKDALPKDFLEALLINKIQNPKIIIKSTPQDIKWRLALIDYLQLLLPVRMRKECTFVTAPHNPSVPISINIKFDSHTNRSSTDRVIYYNNLDLFTAEKMKQGSKYTKWALRESVSPEHFHKKLNSLRINWREKKGIRVSSILDKAIEFETILENKDFSRLDLEELMEILDSYKWELTKRRDKYSLIWESAFFKVEKTHQAFYLIEKHSDLLGNSDSTIGIVDNFNKHVASLKRRKKNKYIDIIIPAVTEVLESQKILSITNTFLSPIITALFNEILRISPQEAISLFKYLTSIDDTNINKNAHLISNLLEMTLKKETEYLLKLIANSFLKEEKKFHPGLLLFLENNGYSTTYEIVAIINGSRDQNSVISPIMLKNSYDEFDSPEIIVKIVELLLEAQKHNLITKDILCYLIEIHESGDFQDEITNAIFKYIKQISYSKHHVFDFLDIISSTKKFFYISERNISLIIKLSQAGTEIEKYEAQKWFDEFISIPKVLIKILESLNPYNATEVIRLSQLKKILNLDIKLESEYTSTIYDWLQKYSKNPKGLLIFVQSALETEKSTRYITKQIVKQLISLGDSGAVELKDGAIKLINQMFMFEETALIVLDVLFEKELTSYFTQDNISKLVNLKNRKEEKSKIYSHINKLLLYQPTTIVTFDTLISMADTESIIPEGIRALIKLLNSKDINIQRDAHNRLVQLASNRETILATLEIAYENNIYNIISSETIKTLVQKEKEEPKSKANIWLYKVAEKKMKLNSSARYAIEDYISF